MKTTAPDTGISARITGVHATLKDLMLHGYAHVSGVLNIGLIERLHRDIASQAAAKSPASRDRTLLDGYPRLETFRRVVENDQIHALAMAVCGDNSRLHLVKGAVRVAGEGELTTHTDTGPHTASPFPRPAQFFTIHIICEPFRPEHGATFFVPNSHRLLRDPTPDEVVDIDRVSVNAEPGDLVCWLGETWHGRFSRTTPGERVSLLLMFAAADLNG